MRVKTTTKLFLMGFVGLSLSGCLGNSRPDVDFPTTLRASPPRGGAPVVIGGRVEASRVSLGSLERRVVLTADGTEVGRATLPDARLQGLPPAAIAGEYRGTPIAANCENREISEPADQRPTLVLHRLTFAEVNCQVNYASRPAGTIRMVHSPYGAVVDPSVVASAPR